MMLELVALGALLCSACADRPYSDHDVAELFESEPKAQDLVYSADHREIHYVDFRGGSARVLFIHGSPGSWKRWTPFLANPVMRERAHMLAVDRPGWGESEPGNVIPDLRDQASVIEPLLLRSQQATLLVAHSYGAAIAALLAIEHPSAVRGLLLIAPALTPQSLVKHWYDGFSHVALVRWLLPRHLASAATELAVLDGELRRVDGRLRDIRAPITIIQGLDDRQVKASAVEQLQEQFGGARQLSFIAVPDAGHHVLWDRADLIVNAMITMLDETRRQRPSLGIVAERSDPAEALGGTEHEVDAEPADEQAEQ